MTTNKKEKVELFENTPVPKAVAQLTIPVILNSLVIVIYSLADTYFVGLLNDPIQNAAVTLVTPLLFTFNMVNNLFGMGTSSMMSRSLGSKDYDIVYGSSVFGFYGALCSGILFSLLCICFQKPVLQILGADETTWDTTRGYMLWTVFCGAVPAIMNVVMGHLFRAEGDTVTSSTGSIIGCILNMILDPVFSLPQGFHMGARGVGFATFLSNCVSCMYFFIIFYRKKGKTYVCFNIKKLIIKKEVIFGIFNVGVPAAIQNLLNVTGMTILTNFTSRFGSDAVASMGIAQKINMVPVQIALGFSQGIMPLVSYNFASENYSRMKKIISFTLKILMPSVAVITIVYYMSAEGLVGLFMKNKIIVSFGSRFLKGFCLSIPFMCLDSFVVGIFQALGMGKMSFVFAILRKVVLEIPALLILNFFIPLYGLAYAQFTAELVLSIAAVVMLIWIFRDKLQIIRG